MPQFHYEVAEVDRRAIPEGKTEAQFVVDIMNAHENRGESFVMFYDSPDGNVRTHIFKLREHWSSDVAHSTDRS